MVLDVPFSCCRCTLPLLLLLRPVDWREGGRGGTDAVVERDDDDEVDCEGELLAPPCSADMTESGGRCDDEVTVGIVEGTLVVADVTAWTLLVDAAPSTAAVVDVDADGGDGNVGSDDGEICNSEAAAGESLTVTFASETDDGADDIAGEAERCGTSPLGMGDAARSSGRGVLD